MVTAPWLILLLVGCSSTNIWEGFHIRSTWFWAMKLFGWFYSPYFGCMFRKANRRPKTWGGPMECHACRGWVCSSCRALACLGGSSGWCTGRRGDFDVCLWHQSGKIAVLHIHFGVSGQMWNTIDELPKNQMLENAHQYSVLYDYELWFTVYQVLYIEYYTCMVWVEDTLCLSLSSITHVLTNRRLKG